MASTVEVVNLSEPKRVPCKDCANYFDGFEHSGTKLIIFYECAEELDDPTDGTCPNFRKREAVT